MAGALRCLGDWSLVALGALGDADLPWSGGCDITRFAIKLLLIFGILVAPWPRLEASYRSGFRAAANAMVAQLEMKRIRFRPAVSPPKRFDTELETVIERRSTARGIVRRTQSFYVSSRDPYYLTSALLIALMLATPVAWRIRGICLGAGLLLLHLYLASRLWILLSMLRAQDPLPWLPWLSVPSKRLALDTVHWVPWYVAPVFIWIVIAVPAVLRAPVPWRVRRISSEWSRFGVSASAAESRTKSQG